MIGSCAAYIAQRTGVRFRLDGVGLDRMGLSDLQEALGWHGHVVAGLGFDGETRRLAENLKERAPGPPFQTRPMQVIKPSLHAAPAGEGKPPPFLSLCNPLNTPSRAPSTLKQSPSFFAITLAFSRFATTQETVLSS